MKKKAFDIDGLGEKIVLQLMNAGLISAPADIFKLEKSELVDLERFADKSAENLIESINHARKIFLPRFIYGLGITHVGEETAIELIKLGAVDYVLKDRLVRLPVAIKRALDEAKEKEIRRLAEESLKVKMKELQRFHDLTVGRELAMIELKKEVNELLLKSGQQEKYKIVG